MSEKRKGMKVVLPDTEILKKCVSLLKSKKKNRPNSKEEVIKILEDEVKDMASKKN